MFRRRIQRVLRRMGRADFSSSVQQANQLMASGDYPAAADAFKELAQDAEEQFSSPRSILIYGSRPCCHSQRTNKGRHGLPAARTDHLRLAGTHPSYADFWSTGNRRTPCTQLDRRSG